MREKATVRFAMGILILFAIVGSLLPNAEVQAQQPISYGPPTWPYKVYPESSPFGAASVYDFQGKHTGVDVWGQAGTQVYATCSGTIVWWDDWPFSGSGSWVNTIWIDCRDGSYYGFTHLDDQQPHVVVGNEILVGQQIAVIGPIERSGAGDDDHLHWMKTKTDPRAINSGNLSWIFEDPTVGVDFSRSPADRLAEASATMSPVIAPQILCTKSYNMALNYKSMPGYKANMLMTLWGTSPGTKYEGAFKAIPSDGFSGSYTFNKGSYWLNGVFGPFTIGTGWTYSEVGSEKEGGGACDISSMVAETLACAGFDVPKDDPTTAFVEGYVEHATNILGVDPLYSIAVSTSSSTNDFTRRNNHDILAINPFESARLEWTVSGDTLTMKVVRPGTGETLSTAPIVDPSLSTEEKITQWSQQNPEYDPAVRILTDGVDQLRRWLYGNGEDVTIKVADGPISTTSTKPDSKMILVSIGVFLLILIVFLWLKPGSVGRAMMWVSNKTPVAISTWKFVIRKAFSYWLFIMAFAIMSTPILRAGLTYGFIEWAGGSTTISHKMFLVVVGALMANLWLQSWGMAKTIRTRDGYIREIPSKKTGFLWGVVKFTVSVSLVFVLFTTVSGVNLIKAFEPTPEILPSPATDSTIIGKGLPPAVQYWAPDIAKWAAQYGKNGTEDPLVMAVVMTFESCGRPTAGSSAGAQGLFQVMPSHWVASDRVASIMQDPESNAKKGFEWINTCFSLYWPNDPERAFGCYNGGAGGVKGPKSNWPAETQRYVSLTVPAFNELKASNGQSSPTIVEWRSPGDSFCRQAETVLSQTPWNSR